MSTSLTIRPAAADDIIALAGLLTQLHRAEGTPHIANAEALTKELFGDGRKVELRALVAVEQKTIVGAALYYVGYDVLTHAYGYHLADLVVDATRRRKGIGRRLLGEIAARNLAEKGEWISLTVLSKNETAQAFYASLGLKHVPVDFFAAGQAALTALAAT